MRSFLQSALIVASYLVNNALALGTSCTAPLGAGTAAAGDPFWLQNISHQGTSAFNPNPKTYQVFRNVKDFGAKGDGVTDDTSAINAAIADQGRCGQGCASSTVSPALVYFPSGTYLVSAPVEVLYYTALVGDAKSPPVIRSSPNFDGFAVIDADPAVPNGGGAEFYVNQNNFYRSVRNFVIDTTAQPPSSPAIGIHWQVSQATGLQNVRINLSTKSGNTHRGIYIENGSGGFFSDITITGGAYGLYLGNQQFTIRNIVVNNATTGIYLNWDWDWTFQNVMIKFCQTGFKINTASGGTEAAYILDSAVINTPQAVVMTTTPTFLPGSVILDNLFLSVVSEAVSTTSGAILLPGPGLSLTTIGLWAQGNIYSGNNPNPTYVQKTLAPVAKPIALLDASTKKIFTRSRPQYENYAASQFVSVKSQGAKGDGKTDDTAAIQAVLNKFAGCKIIFFDAGTYVVTSTITIPANTVVVGEMWPVILASGSFFASASSPRPVIKVGNAGDIGTVEISNMIYSTVGGSAGAIMVEWNIHDAGVQGSVGMWDSHVRLGGSAGTKLQASQCPAGGSPSGSKCVAASLSLHITPTGSGYFENMWAWTADHDLDDPQQRGVDVFSGRGIFDESAEGPVWLIGTASEHHVLYQYNFAGTQNVFAGLIQTETPYFQPTPAPPTPFSLSSTLNDPVFPAGLTSAWALNIEKSNNVIIAGAGLYSFFSSHGQGCQATASCQSQIVNVDSVSTNIVIYSLSTVASTFQLSIGGSGIINQNQNPNGFAATVTIWTSTKTLNHPVCTKKSLKPSVCPKKRRALGL